MDRNIYEKVSDFVYDLGNNIVIRFNVSVGTISSDDTKKRKSFHQEFSYTKQKYSDVNRVITIKRDYDYYFSIECTDKSVNYKDREYIMIGVEDIIYLKMVLKQAQAWMTDSSIYKLKDNNAILVGKVEPLVANFNIYNKCISIEPITMRSAIGLSTTGVRITLNNRSELYTDLIVDKFMGLCYVMDCYNMPMMAANMVNCLYHRNVDITEVSYDDKPSYRYSGEYINAPEPTAKKGRRVGCCSTDNTLDNL